MTEDNDNILCKLEAANETVGGENKIMIRNVINNRNVNNRIINNRIINNRIIKIIIIIYIESPSSLS